MIEKLIELYTRLGKGVYNEEFRLKTKAVLMHLIDNGFSEKEIAKVITSIKIKNYMEFKDLPDYLWEDSLLKRDTFYYNQALQLVSQPPVWNPETMQQESEPFYLEMKIRFTMDDLLNYYYQELRVNPTFRDANKDKGALQYLLNKYKLNNIQSIDVVLFLIDELKATSSGDINISSPLELQGLESTVITYLNSVLPNKTLNNSNKIVWRICNE